MPAVADGHRDHWIGVAVTAAAATAGSPTGLLVRLLRRIGPWSILMWRTGPYLAALAIAWASVGASNRADAVARVRWTRGTLAAGVLLAAQSVALVVAVLHTTVANVSCVQQLAPVFCAVGDRVAGDRLPWRTVAMVFTGLAGAVVIFAGEVELASHALGLCVALGNPLSWALYWFILRRQEEAAKAESAKQREEHSADEEETEGPVGDAAPRGETPVAQCARSVPVLSLAGVTCAVVGGVVGAREHDAHGAPINWLWLCLFGGVCLPLAQLLFTVAPTFIPSAEIACVKMLEVILSPLLVYFYDGETPGWNTYVGGALIVTAVLGHSAATLREQAAERRTDAAATSAVALNTVVSAEVSCDDPGSAVEGEWG